MTLTLATPDHHPHILEMARNFHQASPYRDEPFQEGEVMRLIEGLSTDPANSVVIVLLNEDTPVGVLAATSTKNLFNRQRTATELMFWVEPAFRGKHSWELVEAYEWWARHKVRCDKTILVTLADERLGKVYRRKGYLKTEDAFMKVF